MTDHTTENDARLRRDAIAGIVEDVLIHHMSLGTSGRYIVDYRVTPADLAESIAARIIPPGKGSDS